MPRVLQGVVITVKSLRVVRYCWLCSMLVLSFFSQQTIGHSGGLDSSGCHGGSKPYHCHRAASEMVGNRLRCDLGSKSKECNGTGVASSTYSNTQVATKLEASPPVPDFKYQPSIPDMPILIKNQSLRLRTIKLIQKRLSIYGLYGGKMDGIVGAKTAGAIELFKVKKGYMLGGYLDMLSLKQLGVYEFVVQNGG